MLLQELLANQAILGSTDLSSTRENLMGLMRQSNFDQLVNLMKEKTDWEEHSIIKVIENHMECSAMFRNFRETYSGMEGLVNKILLPCISTKPDTKPGELVNAYRKDAHESYFLCDEGSSSFPANFHVNHELIWVVETNNKVANKNDETQYGEGVKYIIYIYMPTEQIRKDCHSIKLQLQLKNAGIFEEIKKIENDAAIRISQLKETAGIKD